MVVIDEHNTDIAFIFDYHTSSTLKLEDFEICLLRYLNHEPGHEVAKQMREYGLKLSGLYRLVYVCNNLRVGMTHEKIERRRYWDSDAHKWRIPLEHADIRLQLSKRASLCGIEVRKYKRMEKKLDIYQEYLLHYLQRKDTWDTVTTLALTWRKMDTRTLDLLYDLLFDPFRKSDEVGKPYGIDGDTVRRYMKRINALMVSKERVNEELRMELSEFNERILRPLNQVVFDRKGHWEYK